MTALEQNRKNLNDCILGRRPQQTPCLLFVNFPLISSMTGVSSREYFGDPKSMLDAQVETYRRLGADGPISPDFGTVAEASALGGQVVYDNTGIPSIHADPDKDIEVLAELSPADPYNAGMMAKLLEFLEYFVAHAPQDMWVTSSNVMAPVTAAATLRGISDFCMDMIDEPELVEKLLQTVAETEIAFLKAQQEILKDRFDRVLLSDDISSFLSEAQFCRFEAPLYRKIYGAFPDAQRWLHNDGEALHLAASVAQTGVQLWHIGKCVDAQQMFLKTGGQVALCGNLEPIGDLLNGTPETVYARAKEEIERFRQTGRHICTTGGFLSYGTPAENIRAMMQAANAL